MRKSIVLSAVLSGVLLLTGCGGPTLDTSSQDAFKKSVEEISKSLEPAKRDQFETAVAALMLSKVVMSPDANDEASMQKKVKEVFGGKSVDEIIAAADKERAESKAEMEKLMK